MRRDGGYVTKIKIKVWDEMYKKKYTKLERMRRPWIVNVHKTTSHNVIHNGIKFSYPYPFSPLS